MNMTKMFLDTLSAIVSFWIFPLPPHIICEQSLGRTAKKVKILVLDPPYVELFSINIFCILSVFEILSVFMTFLYLYLYLFLHYLYMYSYLYLDVLNVFMTFCICICICICIICICIHICILSVFMIFFVSVFVTDTKSNENIFLLFLSLMHNL